MKHVEIRGAQRHVHVVPFFGIVLGFLSRFPLSFPFLFLGKVGAERLIRCDDYLFASGLSTTELTNPSEHNDRHGTFAHALWF